MSLAYLQSRKARLLPFFCFFLVSIHEIIYYRHLQNCKAPKPRPIITTSYRTELHTTYHPSPASSTSTILSLPDNGRLLPSPHEACLGDKEDNKNLNGACYACVYLRQPHFRRWVENARDTVRRTSGRELPTTDKDSMEVRVSHLYVLIPCLRKLWADNNAPSETTGRRENMLVRCLSRPFGLPLNMHDWYYFGDPTSLGEWRMSELWKPYALAEHRNRDDGAAGDGHQDSEESD